MLEYEYASQKNHTSTKNQNLLLRLRIKPPKLTNRDWSIYIDKTVNQEYYIMDSKAFVGIIGGTMGLFGGLSFMDINSGIVDLIVKLIEFIKQKKSKIDQTL